MWRAAVLALIVIFALSEAQRAQPKRSPRSLRDLLARIPPGRQPGSGSGGPPPRPGSGSGEEYPPPPPTPTPPPYESYWSGDQPEDFESSWFGQIVCREIDCGGWWWGDYESMWLGSGSPEYPDTPESLWSGSGSGSPEYPDTPESLWSGSGSGSGRSGPPFMKFTKEGSGGDECTDEMYNGVIDYIVEYQVAETEVAWWMGYCSGLESDVMSGSQLEEYLGMYCQCAWRLYPDEAGSGDYESEFSGSGSGDVKVHKPAIKLRTPQTKAKALSTEKSTKKAHSAQVKTTSLKDDTLVQLMKLMKIKQQKMH